MDLGLADRDRDRTVRDLRGRAVRLQGGVRGVRLRRAARGLGSGSRSTRRSCPSWRRRLPIPDEHKNTTRGSESPIRVVDEVFTAGDARRGRADPRVQPPQRRARARGQGLQEGAAQEHDARQVRRHPDADRGARAAADEPSHARLRRLLPPHPVPRAGARARARAHQGRRARDRGAPRAQGALLRRSRRPRPTCSVSTASPSSPTRAWCRRASCDPLPWTYVAGLFRAARFGTTEAHGLGVVIQANYLLDKGAIAITARRAASGRSWRSSPAASRSSPTTC